MDIALVDLCSLNYWYSRVLELQSEAHIDISVRARRAVLEALKAVTSGASGSPEALLAVAWTSRKLPSALADPSLSKVAHYALGRGTALINSARMRRVLELDLSIHRSFYVKGY